MAFYSSEQFTNGANRDGLKHLVGPGLPEIAATHSFPSDYGSLRILSAMDGLPCRSILQDPVLWAWNREEMLYDFPRKCVAVIERAALAGSSHPQV